MSIFGLCVAPNEVHCVACFARGGRLLHGGVSNIGMRRSRPCCRRPTHRLQIKFRVSPAQAQQIGKGEEFQRQSPAKARQNERERTWGIVEALNPEIAASSASNAGLAETKAIDQISAVVRDALSLRKTLVVWLVEQSAEAAPLSRNMADHICEDAERS